MNSRFLFGSPDVVAGITGKKRNKMYTIFTWIETFSISLSFTKTIGILDPFF
jgi:hypothetical protein